MAPAASEIDQDASTTLRKLCMKPENKSCIDCKARNPTWASTGFGVFVCLDCSGRHRSLGTHITFVRSVGMDKWTKKDVLRMQLGGNSKAFIYFKKYGVAEMGIEDKYSGKVGQMYRDNLENLVNDESWDGEETTSTTSFVTSATDTSTASTTTTIPATSTITTTTTQASHHDIVVSPSSQAQDNQDAQAVKVISLCPTAYGKTSEGGLDLTSKPKAKTTRSGLGAKRIGARSPVTAATTN